MNGIILVDKPQGFTSFDAVNFLKKRFKLKKVGHAGTLDPLATGLLVVLVGKATKLAQKFLNDSKAYEVGMRLGITTDTLDTTGKVIKECESWPGSKEVKSALSEIKGEIDQIPPAFCALKFKGQRLYKLARMGKPVILAKRKIFIHSIKKIKITLPEVFFEVECSKGTYIRSLSGDIGDKLGCGAVLFKLRRIKSGEFKLKDAVSIDELRKLKKQEQLSRFLIKLNF